MQLLTRERATAIRTISLIRNEVRRLRPVLVRHKQLPLFLDWLRAIEEKVAALEAAVVEGTARSLPPWYESTLIPKVRADRTLSIAYARTILKHFRRVEEATDALARTLGRRREVTAPLLVLLGNVIVDFITLESALYARFPELEPEEAPR